jgi:hypothetical protein
MKRIHWIFAGRRSRDNPALLLSTLLAASLVASIRLLYPVTPSELVVVEDFQACQSIGFHGISCSDLAVSKPDFKSIAID